MTEFLLPHELLDGAGVPDAYRMQVAYLTLCSKYCALVEATMELTDGAPVRISLERAKEILAQNPRTTDPRDIVMVAETKPGEEPGPDVDVRLATIDEIRAANHRYALSRMGSSRN